MANSAHSVLPAPEGAATNTLPSPSYNAENTCVWMALKAVSAPVPPSTAPPELYSAAYSALRSAPTGSGARSSSSVCGENLAGRTRWVKGTAHSASACSQRSDTTRM